MNILAIQGYCPVKKQYSNKSNSVQETHTNVVSFKGAKGFAAGAGIMGIATLAVGFVCPPLAVGAAYVAGRICSKAEDAENAAKQQNNENNKK